MATEEEQKKDEEVTQTRSHGGRNLIILGIASILIALATTSVSLAIYRATGDIYLDRSRPGFISEGEQHNEEDDSREEFSNEGEMDDRAFEEYLKELDLLTERIDGSKDNFAPDPLSDDSLGIIVYDDDEEEELNP